MVGMVFMTCSKLGPVEHFQKKWGPANGGRRALAETIESGPLCITDLFQNKSVAYF